MCASFAVEGSFTPLTTEFLVPGRAAAIRVDEKTLGLIGQLSPAIAERRELPPDAMYVLELDLDALSASAPGANLARPLPKHPSIVRDLSILVDDTLSAETVRGTIRAASPTTLLNVREFDRYQGKGIPDGKISLSLRLTFQAPERTLTDSEAQAAMEGIVQALTKTLGAIQR